jgi:hypothetical protein
MKQVLSAFSLITLLLISCGTTNSAITSNSAYINKYKYATINRIMEYAGDPTLMFIEVEIFDILNAVGLRMIGENQIADLTEKEQKSLLLVKYSAFENDKEAVVSMNFVEYSTRKPIAACRGSSRWTLKAATANLFKQAKLVFRNSYPN